MSSDGGIGDQRDAWLAACRRAVEAHRGIFAEHTGIAGRTQYEGVGEGGDHTLVIDRLCEDAVFEELEKLHADGLEFTAISEERGEVAFGEGPVRVVIDPIDGSMNARRTIPQHSLSIAVTSGGSMADVEFGFVHDFGADEEFSALRGDGARLGGEPFEISLEPGLEAVGLESAKPSRVVAAAGVLADRVYRLRVIGSIAINLAWVSTGRLDGMLSLRPCRSVDAAAGQLIVTEAGGTVSFGDLDAAEVGLGLDSRFDIAASRAEQDMSVLLEAIAAV
jgi:myo-inositol-1(or 4)-monophosphatase